MSTAEPQAEPGVTAVSAQVHARLQRYLEAQYHIRDEGIIQERHLLLGEAGAISQEPFIEVTPSYALGTGFAQLSIPPLLKDLLVELLSWKPSVGVFPPYQHQAEALEAFFPPGREGDDLIVATGTGSGKTETFLYSILGSLAVEAAQRPESFAQDGIRALLLYPMNALVTDQTARLRKLFGDERLASLFRSRWGRHPRFGMYTSRTPYPGVRSGTKDQRYIAPVLAYYEGLLLSDNPDDRVLVEELRGRGRWPAKNLLAFLGRSEEEVRAYQTGRRAAAGDHYTRRNWDRRLTTQPDDRELLTRHEIQMHSPDLLVTNYSMLEYMLLRPIERSLFLQTRAWLEADARNQLLLVLDEAHMYRGVAGAEVGLLIRRLQSRLGIPRERMRCVLTSASLGTGAAADEAVQRFAAGLAGQPQTRTYRLIRGTLEPRVGSRQATQAEADSLSAVDPATLAGAALNPVAAQAVTEAAEQALGVRGSSEAPPDLLALRQRVAGWLSGFGPLELAIATCSGNATAFKELARTLFPTASGERAARATDGVLALGTFARRSEPLRQEQPLLPARVHLFFRGLPPVFACINPECLERRHRPGDSLLLGRLFTEPREACLCGARVFELLTHRDCGAAFLRVFAYPSTTPDFYWHERGGLLSDFGAPLHEVHVLLEEPHPHMRDVVSPLWLELMTGRAYRTPLERPAGIRMTYEPSPASGKSGDISTFGRCPVCKRATQGAGPLKIMDLATKGEQPFANLVREQFVCQVATSSLDERHPNGGRKALLFSDGRQKAARLARDLPREVERDSFREALAAAIDDLKKLGREILLDDILYAAFVAVCAKHHLHFFDGLDQSQLLEECARFRTDYDNDLRLALDEAWRPAPPIRYRQALLRQVSDPYYSLVAACAAVVEPSQSKLRLLERRLRSSSPDTLREVAAAFVRRMLGKHAFDPALSHDSRQDEFPFFQPVRAADGLKSFFADASKRMAATADDIAPMREAIFEVLTREGAGGDDSGRLLSCDALSIRLALDDVWLQCLLCGHLQLRPYFQACDNCGLSSLDERPAVHPYMIARKGFFREPLRAVLAGARPVHITAEEHTAQLSQRDAGDIYASTEEFELRFQDVPLGTQRPPVDVLSCTTTMEVGIDIGSLTAVGLRTVPPQRENYQQRSGRAGRRGTSVSCVLTFAQGGAHDAHYFENPHALISGPPREPRIKSDNRRLARRHIHSHLLQTFFHSQLDALSDSDLQALIRSTPSIMSAFGSARDFFQGSGTTLTLDAFEHWVESSVLSAGSIYVSEVIGWLPAAMWAPDKDSASEKQAFVQDVAQALLRRLRLLAEEPRAQISVDDEDDSPSADGLLLDVLFDAAILPSYAFPTDLCSFVIQEWDEQRGVRTKERPQLSRAQALSEYAPGRLLVVNKTTYRVGGIFVEGPPTASPAIPLFTGQLTRYVGCDRCTFVRLEEGDEVTAEGSECPVCKAALRSREMLEPPGFSPENGRALREGDREQELTYASSAQLPELVGGEAFVWRTGAHRRLTHAYGEDVLLVVANKGKDGQGFAICDACGAAWPRGEEPTGTHQRPFLVPQRVLAKEGASRQCSGVLRRGLFLGHQFRTDILLLRIVFHRPFDFSPHQPWLYDALATLAEALALGASLHEDIDPGELSAGFRLLPALDGESGVAEIYLFDTADGGAGYAAEAGEKLAEVLAQTATLLAECPANCDRSCTRCLRHYGNRFLHTRLDRALGLDLLRYAQAGTIPTIEPTVRQRARLSPLARWLQLEGWTLREPSAALDDVPILATPPGEMDPVAIGTYPVLLAVDTASGDHPVRRTAVRRTCLLPDYLVSRDLPAAYQVVVSSRVTGRSL